MATKEQTLLFEKYQYLASEYAKKLFDTRKISMEYQDVLQEFRLHLYTSVLAYMRAVEKFEQTGFRQPVPAPFYLMSCMKRHVVDFISTINSEKTNTVSFFDKYDLDFGVTNNNHIESDLNNEKLSINGYDIFQGMNPRERKVFALFLKGLSKEEMRKIFKDNVDVDSIIDNKISYLKKNKNAILEKESNFVKVTSLVEEDC